MAVTIVIPAEAVIRSGARNQVFIVRAPGKFEPRLVTLGLASNGKVAVEQGVNVGEEVVVSAQFLIDSDSSSSRFPSRPRLQIESSSLRKWMNLITGNVVKNDPRN